MAKKGLTIEQHKELGKKLSNIQNELTQITMLLSRAYPVKARTEKYVTQATKNIGLLRAILDNLIFVEHGKELSEYEINHVYFPGQVKK
jgi:septation ring formation regulator EzrA